METPKHYDCIPLIFVRNFRLQLLEIFVKPCCSFVGVRNLVFDVKEEHNLRVFENRVLNGAEWDEIL
jgi:hypothetical protein